MNEEIEYAFRLYVAGDSPNSFRAMENLKAFCADYLSGNHSIEIVDILEDSTRALEDGVFLTPMLQVLSPRPDLRIVGALNQKELLVQALHLSDAVKETE